MLTVSLDYHLKMVAGGHVIVGHYLQSYRLSDGFSMAFVMS